MCETRETRFSCSSPHFYWLLLVILKSIVLQQNMGSDRFGSKSDWLGPVRSGPDWSGPVRSGSVSEVGGSLLRHKMVNVDGRWKGCRFVRTRRREDQIIKHM